MAFRVLRRPSPAMVVACTALIVALSGTGYAAIKLPARSVGAKQLKTGAVTNIKLARRAVTGGKVALNTLTGAQINEATLGTVRNATHASTADSATHATAGTATNVAAPEAWHLVGANGEPLFQHSWQNGLNTSDEPLSFYKDRSGVVHLRGRIINGSPNNSIFQLPAGYRPAAGKYANFPAACECTGAQATIVSVEGSGIGASDGSVTMQNGSLSPGNYLSLDGISFRAES